MYHLKISYVHSPLFQIMMKTLQLSPVCIDADEALTYDGSGEDSDDEEAAEDGKRKRKLSADKRKRKRKLSSHFSTALPTKRRRP